MPRKKTLPCEEQNLFDPGLSLLEEPKSSIAHAALVSSRREPLSNDGVISCFDDSVLVSFGPSNRGVELWPVDLFSSQYQPSH